MHAGMEQAGLAPEEAATWTLSALLQAGSFLSALLQAGSFLYRLETEPGSTDVFSAEALAGRLAFLVWGQGPDEALLEAARSGGLETQAGIDAAAERLLADERAVAHSLDYVTDWLGIANLDRHPVAGAYPEVDASLLAAMRPRRGTSRGTSCGPSRGP